MAGGKMQIFVFLAALAAVVGICSAATTHIVGDTAGWTIPTSPTLYSSWASKQKLQVGDTLVFNFPAGAHTVAEVSKSAYDSCTTSSPISAVLTTAPANFTIKSPGTHYYICTITGHCSAGQKLAVVAAASSTAAAPKSSKKGSSAPAPAPAATSTTPPATAETPAAAPGATVPTTSDAAGAPASPTASPPGANFAAPKVAGFGVFGLISVAAAAMLA